MEADGLQVINWYVDVAFVVYHDMHSYNRIMMNLGKGCVYGSSGKININTTSSNMAEKVGFSDPPPSK